MAAKFRGHLKRSTLIRDGFLIAFSFVAVGFSANVLAHAWRYGEIKALNRHSDEMISLAKQPWRFRVHEAAWAIVGIGLFGCAAVVKVNQLRGRWLGVDDHPSISTNFWNR
jgi:hypothetical protein